MYLRLTRTHAAACHDQVIAQYRRHPAAMSGDTLNMLRMALFVLHEQRSYLTEHPGALEAYRRDSLSGSATTASSYRRCAGPSRLRAADPGRQFLSMATRARTRWRAAGAAQPRRSGVT